MVEVNVVIRGEVGLHARPAALFVQTAGKYQSTIWVLHGDRRGNAKSILGVLAVGAVKNSEITICADGVDEVEAVEDLKSLVERDFEGQATGAPERASSPERPNN